MEAEIVRTWSSTRRVRWQIHLPAALIACLGLINVLWVLFPHQLVLEALGRWSPIFDESIEMPEAFFSGAGLLFLSWSLWRGKHSAWLVVLALSAPLVLLYALDGFNFYKSISAAVLVLVLLACGRHFNTRTSPIAARRGLGIWGFGLALSLGLGLLTSTAIYPLSERLSAIVVSTLGGFVISLTPAGVWLEYENGQLLTILHFGLGVISWTALFWMLDQPAQAPALASPEERKRARQIVQAHGRTSQAHLTLLEDKTYYFSAGGSFIAYTVCGRSAVTLGDPIGPVADALAVIQSFARFAARNDWRVVFSLTSSEYLDLYRRLGFGALCLGHEGIIDLAAFSMKGNASKTFRKRYNRLVNLGYKIEIYEPPISNALLAELRQVSDEWLSMAQAAEKRFFLACFKEEYVRSERLAVVRTPDGTISAFANLVPEYQLNELSIDLMRRRREIEPGTMDFLFASLFLWAREHGYKTFNLGLSPLFGVGGRPGSSLLEVFIYSMYEHGTFYDFKGLNGFKIKFRPSWSPQYLVYPSFLSLPVAGLALARANAGEGETLLDYFRPRHKPLHHELPEDLSVALDNSE